MKGGIIMAKIKGKRIMAKLIGMKSTIVWLTKEQQEMVNSFGVTNQEFAQIAFDVCMDFMVSLTRREVIDYDGEELTEDDKKIVAKAFAKEFIRHLPKEGEKQ